MSRVDPDGQLLPRGISYETARGRYRIRLYFRDRVIWLSYKRSLKDALVDLQLAQAAQRKIDLSQNVARGATGLAAMLQGNDPDDH